MTLPLLKSFDLVKAIPKAGIAISVVTNGPVVVATKTTEPRKIVWTLAAVKEKSLDLPFLFNDLLRRHKITQSQSCSQTEFQLDV